MFMPTKKPQILLTVDEDLLKRIEKFKENKKFFSRSEAVRQLIEAGLKTTEKKKWGSQEKTATVNAVYLSFPSIAGHSSSSPSSLRNCAISALIAARSDSISA